jgi:threonine/homoserine/homoserine lactone efflux protein
MRYAQWISTGVYFVFILLVTPYFKSDLPVNGGETQIIDMLAAVGVLVAPVIILTALASQLSAAVADMNGAGGLLEDASNSNITVRGGYFITALMALIITWSADIFEIITYASKAFMLYYGLQCITALIALKKIDNIRSTHRTALQALFLTAALIALLIVVLGKAVS